jgi:hypothetical protein
VDFYARTLIPRIHDTAQAHAAVFDGIYTAARPGRRLTRFDAAAPLGYSGDQWSNQVVERTQYLQEPELETTQSSTTRHAGPTAHPRRNTTPRRLVLAHGRRNARSHIVATPRLALALAQSPQVTSHALTARGFKDLGSYI